MTKYLGGYKALSRCMPISQRWRRCATQNLPLGYPKLPCSCSDAVAASVRLPPCRKRRDPSTAVVLHFREA
jgi:hypothetical protein